MEQWHPKRTTDPKTQIANMPPLNKRWVVGEGLVLFGLDCVVGSNSQDLHLTGSANADGQEPHVCQYSFATRALKTLSEHNELRIVCG